MKVSDAFSTPTEVWAGDSLRFAPQRARAVRLYLLCVQANGGSELHALWRAPHKHRAPSSVTPTHRPRTWAPPLTNSNTVSCTPSRADEHGMRFALNADTRCGTCEWT